MTHSSPDAASAGTDEMHRLSGAGDGVVRELAEWTVTRLTTPHPLGSTVDPEALSSAIGPTVTAAGLGAHRAFQLWTEHLEPACIAVDHPRYLAFVPGAPTQLSAAFDMVVGASSVYAGSWLEASGAAFAENQALRWIADLVGMPSTSGGAFVQGGTIGNLSALVTARDYARRCRVSPPARWAVCVTEETHSSVSHSLRTVMDVDVIVVPGDERGRLTGPALAATVEALPAGRRDGIFAVVATAGSTNLGVVDDIEGVAEVARENGWWTHVDGCYGGAGLVAPSVRHLYAGVQHADSFTVDPHKWLFGPFDCCALLYRSPALAHAAHTQHADYLEAVNVEGEWNPSDFAIHLSRRARGLPLWFSLAAHGTDAYRDAVERTLDVTRAGAALIHAAEHVDLLVEPELSVLVFTRHDWEAGDYSQWSDRLLRQQCAFITPTRHRSQVCARIAIINPTTSVGDIQMVIDSMQ